MKTKLFLLGVTTLLFAACQDEVQQPDKQVSETGKTPLSINIKSTPTKAQVSGTLLPVNSELGVFVTKSDGTDYLTDNPYNNIKYTGTGETNATTWTVDPATPVYLNVEKATAYAYFPRQVSYTDLTSIPITNDGTDWMYSAPEENLDFQNATAAFSMQHAMSIIRVKIERANATDQGTISKVTIDGNGWATGATLNLKEGTVGNYTGENSQLVRTNVGTLGESALTYDHWVVPTGNTTDMTFKVTLDDMTYKATQTNVSLQPGKVYNYMLSVSYRTGITINEVTMTDWVDEAKVNMDTEPCSTFADKMKKKFKAVTTDGVYAVKEDGTPVAYAEASEQTYAAVAFVLNGKAYQVAKTDATRYDGAATVYWWKTGYSDIGSLTNYTKADDINNDGYLPRADGSYAENIHLDVDWTKWSNYDNATAALSDFNGEENTNLMIVAQSTSGVVQDYTLAQAVVNFRSNSIVNEGKKYWFCPACGELAFMLLKQNELNALLSKVGGTQLSSDWYWSSSEYSYDYAWVVAFQHGLVAHADKRYSLRLRLLRAI